MSQGQSQFDQSQLRQIKKNEVRPSKEVFVIGKTVVVLPLKIKTLAVFSCLDLRLFGPSKRVRNRIST